MTSPAIKLARECGALVGVKHATDCDGDMVIFTPEELTRFYALAQAQALRDASEKLDEQIHDVTDPVEWLIRMAEELERGA